MAMHNVSTPNGPPVCTSDPYKRKLRPAVLFSVQSDHLPTLFSSLIVANKRILSIFLVARREDLGTKSW